jgi:hypothetical protein
VIGHPDSFGQGKFRLCQFPCTDIETDMRAHDKQGPSGFRSYTGCNMSQEDIFA